MKSTPHYSRWLGQIGAYEGEHQFEFRHGTTVELGADAGYFCKWCGKEQR